MHAEAQIMIRHLLCQNHLGAWAPNGCLRQIEAAAEAAMQRGGSANSRQASGRAGDAGLLAPSGEKKGGGDHGGTAQQERAPPAPTAAVAIICSDPASSSWCSRTLHRPVT